MALSAETIRCLSTGLASNGAGAELAAILNGAGTTYTQTYSTATRTHSDLTSATLAVGTLGGTANGTMESVGATNSGDVSGAIQNNLQELFTQLNALRVDVVNVKGVVNAVIDDLQTIRLVS